jgi:hypothetical protein
VHLQTKTEGCYVVISKHSKFVNRYLDPKQPPKKLFENLRRFGHIKCKNHQKCNADAEELNNHFVVKPSDSRDLSFDVHIADVIPKFSFKTIEPKDVLDAVRLVKSAATGNDGIPMSFIKLLLPIILPTLTFIYNHIFITSEFPQRWKTSIVILVPKVANPNSLSDLRPISLLPCFSKILEIIMAQQMSQHIDGNNLLSPHAVWIQKLT